MPKNKRHGQAALLSDVDALKIRKALKKPEHKLLWDIARFTGERWGAICQLRVSDVYENPAMGKPLVEITFRAQTRKASPDGTRQTRQVPCHSQLADYLRAYRVPRDRSKGDDYLFPGLEDGKPLTFSAADKMLRAALVTAGLDAKGISTHSTRRSFITTLSRRGTSLDLIQCLTGHKDMRTLLRYIEHSPEQLHAAINNL